MVMRALRATGGTGSAWALAAVVTATAAVGCTASGSGGDGGSAASCAYLVRYQERTYLGTGVAGFTIGEELGAATIPPCDDTPDDDSDGRTTPDLTTAYSIKGVDPSVAIALERAGDDVMFVDVDSGKSLPEIKELIHGS
ncbi:DUF6281 family protein [Streptomyces sp. NPDC020490]|uniref:DUF6281 family protein n=1 Tax=Streptomyces sp. NPDC020490 TaxID=3365078 RepID=UPI00378CD812